MDARPCEYSKNYIYTIYIVKTVYIKRWILACELYPNKAVLKRNKIKNHLSITLSTQSNLSVDSSYSTLLPQVHYEVIYHLYNHGETSTLN